MVLSSIVIMILDIAFVAYQFKKSNFNMLWPLKLLRNVAVYFVTVFFIPITGELIILFNLIFKNKINKDFNINGGMCNR